MITNWEDLTKTAVVLDFETDTEDFGSPVNMDNDIVLACWEIVSLETGKILKRAHFFGGALEQEELAKDIVRHGSRVVAHNAKFELGWLKRMGFRLEEVHPFCTMVAERVLQGNRTIGLTLEEVAQRELGEGKESGVSALIKSGVPVRDILQKSLRKYCRIDVDRTTKLFFKQLRYLRERNLNPVFHTRMRACRMLADVEFNGMALDADMVRIEKANQEQALAHLTAEMDKVTGGINPRSPKQVAKFVFKDLGFKIPERTTLGKPDEEFPDGRPSCGEEVLEKLVAKTKKQVRFLELKKQLSKVQARLSKSLNAFEECIIDAEAKGIAPVLYFNYNQHVAATHRLSSSGRRYKVQGQNIPREYKKMFCARSSNAKLAEADYGKLEFVIAAFLSQDPVAIAEVSTGFDVHRYTAAIIKRAAQFPEEDINTTMEEAVKLMPEVTDGERTDAKPDTFGPLFGKTQGDTPAHSKYFEAFKRKYAVLSSVQEEWINEVLKSKDKCLKTITGLEASFPFAKVNKFGYVVENTKIRNYPIQMFATADIAQIGAFLTWEHLKKVGSGIRIVNLVHDSEELEGEETELKAFCKDELETLMITDMIKYLKDVYGIDFNLPLGIGVKIGKHWGMED